MKYVREENEILGPSFVFEYLNDRIEFEKLVHVPEVFKDIYESVPDSYGFTNELRSDSCLLCEPELGELIKDKLKTFSEDDLDEILQYEGACILVTENWKSENLQESFLEANKHYSVVLEVPEESKFLSSHNDPDRWKG